MGLGPPWLSLQLSTFLIHEPGVRVLMPRSSRAGYWDRRVLPRRPGLTAGWRMSDLPDVLNRAVPFLAFQAASEEEFPRLRGGPLRSRRDPRAWIRVKIPLAPPTTFGPPRGSSSRYFKNIYHL